MGDRFIRISKRDIIESRFASVSLPRNPPFLTSNTLLIASLGCTTVAKRWSGGRSVFSRAGIVREEALFRNQTGGFFAPGYRLAH